MNYFLIVLTLVIQLNSLTVYATTNTAEDKKHSSTNLKAIKLAPSQQYPHVDNWWSRGYTGKKGVLGIIDEGVDPNHPALAGKKIILRNEAGSFYDQFVNGVRSPHGTGVACIYASTDQKYKGIAYDVPTIISGPSGEETPDIDSFLKTVSTINWMLERTDVKPTVINYSMGNGRIDCPGCPEWSELAKIIDHIVNQKKILWVNSAGNQGYIKPSNHAPFRTTLTVPAENYNALTVANMNTSIPKQNNSIKTPNRAEHIIRSTSSRGPTPLGRRKPDLTAPGHDTTTCAPDPKVYHLNYDEEMHYQNGFRLMGGTSAAAPHVGAAILLLQDAGINNPVAIKALLINSADTWTDSNNRDEVEDAHFQVMGSAWNRTYGWGYLNMQKAFEQRNDLVEGFLTKKNPEITFKAQVKVGQKITLVHERRVGYFKNGAEWQLSPLSLELIDADTNTVIAADKSPIDTVHQVSNCIKKSNEKECSAETKILHALIKVKLQGTRIDGAHKEPFALLLSNRTA